MLGLWAHKSDDDSHNTLLSVVSNLLDHLSEDMSPEVLAKILDVKVEDVVETPDNKQERNVKITPEGVVHIPPKEGEE